MVLLEQHLATQGHSAEAACMRLHAWSHHSGPAGPLGLAHHPQQALSSILEQLLQHQPATGIPSLISGPQTCRVTICNWSASLLHQALHPGWPHPSALNTQTRGQGWSCDVSFKFGKQGFYWWGVEGAMFIVGGRRDGGVVVLITFVWFVLRVCAGVVLGVGSGLGVLGGGAGGMEQGVQEEGVSQNLLQPVP